MAKSAVLTDNFTTADGVKWNGYGGSATVSGGALNITVTNSYATIATATNYDLVDSYALVQLTQAPNIGNGGTQAYMAVYITGNDNLQFVLENGVLYFRERVGNVDNDTTTSFNAVGHRWWRIRVAGSTAFWETSSNGAAWLVQRTKTLATPTPNNVSIGLGAGYYGTEPAPGTARFDNFNLPASVAATTYYASAAGSDSADGLSQATAWQTLARASQQSFVPGDTLRLRGGDTFTGSLYFGPGIGGTITDRITINSYGTSYATISPANDDGVLVYDTGGITLRNLIITGNGTTYTGKNGINIYADAYGAVSGGRQSNITIDTVDVSSFRNGITIGGDGSGYDGVVITNCAAHGNMYNGIMTYGPAFNASSPTYAISDVTIQYSTAYSNPGDPGNMASNSGNGIVLGSVDTGIVQYCSAYNNGASCNASEGPAAVWTYNSTGITIQHNVAYNNHTGSGAADGDGFDLDINVSNSVIQYNLAYANDGAGILVYTGQANSAHTGNIVRYNICWKNCHTNPYYAEIKVAGNITDCQIYNNTCISGDTGPTTPATVSVHDTGLQNVILRNNIFVQTGTGPIVSAPGNLATTDALFQGNAYYSTGTASFSWNGNTYNSLTAWQTAQLQELVGGEPAGYYGDPLLKDFITQPAITDPVNLATLSGLRLRPGAVTCSLGLDLAGRFGTNIGVDDYFGTVIASPFSVGASQTLAADMPHWSLGTGGGISFGIQ